MRKPVNWFLILFALIPAVYVEAFGEEYERYQDVVGMFFPRFPRKNS